jgi:hypothetical protein
MRENRTPMTRIKHADWHKLKSAFENQRYQRSNKNITYGVITQRII